MPQNRKHKKKEIDADQVIRDYEESSERSPLLEGEPSQTELEWYEQASQDTKVPPEAVLAGGDIDAATPTPDQDIVDELGRAVGVDYEDAEPLHTTEKLERRDEQRWELHPASSEDFSERNQNYYDNPEAPPSQAPRSKRDSSQTKRGTRKAA